MRAYSLLLLAFWTSLVLSSGKGSDASCNVISSGGDDAPHLLNAVRNCETIVIPKSTTLSIRTRLNMTGLADRHISLQGTMKFEPDIPYWTGNGFFFPFQTQITFWILGGRDIVLDGGGTLDGSGQVWWDTFATNSSLLRPITLTIFQATNVRVENIQMINGPEWHNLINEGQNILYNNISIHAVSSSSHFAANTDGWNVYRSDNVVIQNSVIFNGDDCVAFKPNATNVLVSNLNCTGSHGISVGSLGQFPGMFDIVENVTAIDVSMSKAQNGARIKAWAGPNVGSGIVKNITFQNFVESQVDHPVIIDQCYMTNATACSQFPSNVLIQDIWFNNISGTSTGSVVAQLSCSPDGRCSDINVNDLHLSSPSGTARYTCQNVVVEGNSASLFPVCTVT
ncbi:glycoside hydrolase family 28 protein [Amanita thiersii Skay4041]|uniref:galacturonan 1,4-alpha-galacturonidase n=1 Tax=Amanita thiersii Skay4041 TaxID=703135 RepID=A0A2A9NS64_9AGAR|nr:glycoside hydrolase family 28 protein [Amanita thiersii Skay4041]